LVEAELGRLELIRAMQGKKWPIEVVASDVRSPQHRVQLTVNEL